MADQPRRGRPPLDLAGPTTPVPVRLGPTLHDKVCRISARTSLSVGEIQRRALERLPDPKDYDPDDDFDF
jgi:hypothetical protein